MSSWRVPALAVEPAAAAALLAGLAALPPGDVAAGAEIGYLAAAARFAADLAVRGRVLPALVREEAGGGAEDDGYAARWRPVLAGPDARYARELAAAMPAACRAAQETAAGPLLAELLDALTDAAVRPRLPESLLPARRGRRPARVELPERVLPALATPDGRVELAGAADEAAAAELTATFADWLASAARPASAVRTCFRLVEPPADDPASADPVRLAADRGRPGDRPGGSSSPCSRWTSRA